MENNEITTVYGQNNELEAQMPKIVIDDSICGKCGNCVMVCPHGVLIQDGNENIPKTYNEFECISCGHCAAICPKGAINHEDYPTDRIKPINKTIYPSLEQVMCLLKSRRSIRAFKDKNVEEELIELIIDAAASAPSSSNNRNIEYVIVQDPVIINKIVAIISEFYGKIVYVLKNPDIIENLPSSAQERFFGIKPLLPTFERIINRIKAGNDILQRGKPALLVAHAPNHPFDWTLVNASVALQNVSLLCNSLELGSCQLGYVETIMDKDPQIPSLLEIPDDHGIYGVFAFGYPQYTFENWIEREMPKVTWKL